MQSKFVLVLHIDALEKGHTEKIELINQEI
jgi:hypothetical protein